MNFSARDKQTLCNIIFHSVRIRGSEDGRDIILQKMYEAQIRGICRAHGFDEKKILSKMQELDVSGNGVSLFDNITLLVESSRV